MFHFDLKHSVKCKSKKYRKYKKKKHLLKKKFKSIRCGTYAFQHWRCFFKKQTKYNTKKIAKAVSHLQPTHRAGMDFPGRSASGSCDGSWWVRPPLLPPGTGFGQSDAPTRGCEGCRVAQNTRAVRAYLGAAAKKSRVQQHSRSDQKQRSLAVAITKSQLQCALGTLSWPQPCLASHSRCLFYEPGSLSSHPSFHQTCFSRYVRLGVCCIQMGTQLLLHKSHSGPSIQMLSQ